MYRSGRLPGSARAWARRAFKPSTWIVALLLVFSICSQTSRAFVCGDVTHDGRITTADVIYVINYVFKGGSWPEPVECADVNHDYVVTSADAIALVSFIFRAGTAPWCPPEGAAVTHTDCKLFVEPQPLFGPPPDQTCIAFAYDGGGTAFVRHMNAGFNCCPAELRVAVEREPGIIRIIESEDLGEEGGCDCLCLFDLEFQIEDVFGTYTVSVVEPYRPAGNEPLVFEVTFGDLIPMDTFCVTRSGYPWGGGGPSFRIDSTTGCKALPVAAAETDSVSATDDCAFYRYDAGMSILYLDHVNAGFNCCPIIGADIDLTGDVITITERESPGEYGFCACLCLFDVNYEIWQLPPGQYTIRFVELYLEPGDDPLEFVVDLNATPEGSICASRHHYPWEF